MLFWAPRSSRWCQSSSIQLSDCVCVLLCACDYINIPGVYLHVHTVHRDEATGGFHTDRLLRLPGNRCHINRKGERYVCVQYVYAWAKVYFVLTVRLIRSNVTWIVTLTRVSCCGFLLRDWTKRSWHVPRNIIEIVIFYQEEHHVHHPDITCAHTTLCHTETMFLKKGNAHIYTWGIPLQ